MKNLEQAKKEAVNLIHKASKEVDPVKAKEQTLDFLGKAANELKTEVNRQRHILVIVGVVVIAKSIFDLVRSAKARKAGCCNGNCNCVLRNK